MIWTKPGGSESCSRPMTPFGMTCPNRAVAAFELETTMMPIRITLCIDCLVLTLNRKDPR